MNVLDYGVRVLMVAHLHGDVNFYVLPPKSREKYTFIIAQFHDIVNCHQFLTFRRQIHRGKSK